MTPKPPGVFTDEDLKRLKADLDGLSDGQPFDSEGNYPNEVIQCLIARLEAAEIERDILKEIFFGLEKEEHPTTLKLRINETARKLVFMNQSEDNRQLVLREFRAWTEWRKAAGK